MLVQTVDMTEEKSTEANLAVVDKIIQSITVISDIPKDQKSKLIQDFSAFKPDQILTPKGREWADKIIDGLYLACAPCMSGSKPSELSSAMKERGIKRIVKIQSESNSRCHWPSKSFKVTSITLEDNTKSKIMVFLPKLVDFIHEGLANNEGVLVHCYAGMSRSASVVIAYLMKYEKMNFSYAYVHTRMRRTNTYPNDGFVLQLIEYEKSVCTSVPSNIREIPWYTKKINPTAEESESNKTKEKTERNDE